MTSVTLGSECRSLKNILFEKNILTDASKFYLVLNLYFFLILRLYLSTKRALECNFLT